MLPEGGKAREEKRRKKKEATRMIQCVGLNPVLQRTLTLERFTVNAMNRVIGKPLEGSAGKGINAARAIKTLGQQATMSGTTPQHMPETIYKDFVALAAERHIPGIMRIDDVERLTREIQVIRKA